MMDMKSKLMGKIDKAMEVLEKRPTFLEYIFGALSLIAMMILAQHMVGDYYFLSSILGWYSWNTVILSVFILWLLWLFWLWVRFFLVPIALVTFYDFVCHQQMEDQSDNWQGNVYITHNQEPVAFRKRKKSKHKSSNKLDN
jgi:hypothetical protein